MWRLCLRNCDAELSDFSCEVTRRVPPNVTDAGLSLYADRWIRKISHLEINIAAKEGRLGFKVFVQESGEDFPPAALRVERGKVKINDHHTVIGGKIVF